MTTPEAKSILSVYRPGLDEAREPQVAEALALAGQDPELKRWLESQQAIHGALRQKLRSLRAPEHLKAAILDDRPQLLRPGFRPAPTRWFAAAATLVLVGLLLWSLRPQPADRFENYRDRVVRNVIRQYQMDVLSPDLPTIRNFLATNNAPSDFTLPPELARLNTAGAGLQRWRNHPVSMVCFENTDQQMLFLFVLDRKAVSDAPPESPQFQKISRLFSASWTAQNNIFVLACTNEVSGRSVISNH